MALFLLGAFSGIEFFRRPDFLGANGMEHHVPQCIVTDDSPGFHQCRDDRDVTGCLATALTDGTHAMADFQANVPK